ncbi:DUF1403 family protein, partial [Pseudogemmobacter sonorensis]|uniref:DUF1403 family protein n=1 Tax=Pseudogemmobacter sonorensis TaxID=2989681 RepID=UPI0036B024E0
MSQTPLDPLSDLAADPPPDRPEDLAPPGPDLPAWLGREPEAHPPGFAAGAALAWLHPMACSEAAPARLWRRRLALRAVVALPVPAGRAAPTEAELRDHWCLRAEGDDPGPAGRRLAAFHALGESRARDLRDWPARLPRLFDLSGPGAEAIQPLLAAAMAEARAPAPPLR